MAPDSGSWAGTPQSDDPQNMQPSEASVDSLQYAHGMVSQDPSPLGSASLVEPEPLPGSSKPGRPTQGIGRGPQAFAKAALKEAVNETFTETLKHALEVVADVHGLGPLVRSAELAWNTVKWLQVAERDRGLDIEKSISLGAGIEFDIIGHLGSMPSVSEPPFTGCFAPASGPDPGVLVVDGYQISPGGTLEDGPARGSGEAAWHVKEHQTVMAYRRSVVLVNLQLSQLMSRETDAAIRMATLMHLVKDELTPRLRKRRQFWENLRTADVECVICYDQESRDSIWLFFGETGKQADRVQILFDPVGKLIP